MGTASIAIWNRTKLAKGIAIGIWVINLGFLIHSKHLHYPLLQTIGKPPSKYTMTSDVVQVNNQST